MPKINITVDVPEGENCSERVDNYGHRKCIHFAHEIGYCRAFRTDLENFNYWTINAEKCEDCLKACEEAEKDETD